MTINNFKSDLEFGQKYELELLQYLDYDTYEQAEGNFKLWDIKTIKDGVEICYEVKADRKAIETKNIAIEYESYGCNSGIKTTKCHYWCHYCIDPLGGYQLYMIPRKDLIKMINRGEYKRISNINNHTFFVLIEMSKLKQYLYKTVY